MKSNIADKILEKVMSRIEGVSDILSEQYRGVRPFDSRELSPDERLQIYFQFSQDPNLMMQKIQREGRDAVNKYIEENEALLRRRQKL